MQPSLFHVDVRDDFVGGDKEMALPPLIFDLVCCSINQADIPEEIKEGICANLKGSNHLSKDESTEGGPHPVPTY